MKHGVTRFYFRYVNKYICSTFPHEHSLKIFVNILTIYIYIYAYILCILLSTINRDIGTSYF